MATIHDFCSQLMGSPQHILIKDEHNFTADSNDDLINKPKCNPKAKSAIQYKTEINQDSKQKFKKHSISKAHTPVVFTQSQ